MKYLTIIAFLCLMMSACDSGPQADKPTGDTKPSAAAKGSSAGSGAVAAKEPDSELDKEDIPVASDFEEKAEKEITKDNLDDELAKLEKEVASDGDTKAAKE
ncbi:MAG: hypothetical protein DRI90_15425 [Deltaproteobacteria bacterium]|nr:MAG: hypothetical protein DRI90_15425 [Deltaproteobacteria bacterium]